MFISFSVKLGGLCKEYKNNWVIVISCLYSVSYLQKLCCSLSPRSRFSFPWPWQLRGEALWEESIWFDPLFQLSWQYNIIVKEYHWIASNGADIKSLYPRFHCFPHFADEQERWWLRLCILFWWTNWWDSISGAAFVVSMNRPHSELRLICKVVQGDFYSDYDASDFGQGQESQVWREVPSDFSLIWCSRWTTAWITGLTMEA